MDPVAATVTWCVKKVARFSIFRLHPQGWVAVSRNTSSDEASEWCCVHDIHSVETRYTKEVVIVFLLLVVFIIPSLPRSKRRYLLFPTPSAPFLSVSLQLACNYCFSFVYFFIFFSFLLFSFIFILFHIILSNSMDRFSSLPIVYVRTLFFVGQIKKKNCLKLKCQQISDS